MKSLSKAHVSSALQTWSPPDLDNELFPVDVDAHKEQVLTVLKKGNGQYRSQKVITASQRGRYKFHFVAA